MAIDGNRVETELVVTRKIQSRGITDSPPVSVVGSGEVYFDLASGKYKVSENGSGYTNLVGGASTSAITVTAAIVAQDTLAQFDPVTITGKKADSSNNAYFGKVIGLANGAIAIGFSGDILVEGLITNGSWSWTAGDRIFLNGTILSTTSPSVGFSQQIAVAKNSTTIYVDLSIPILL